ncbi:YxeA family protein [Mycoplasma sp. P36-A1]|uniref:YxeA family protein n=1 Tax=Mycoplasma sp. P36-A1 TaxID=3252900 RepID=UPI003C2C64FE
MKKFLLVLLAAIVVLAVGSYKLISDQYKGDSYYTQITTDGEKKSEKIDDGSTVVTFSYSLPSYDEKGNMKVMNFNGTNSEGKQLRKDAYLKLEYNDDKGVISWEEVQFDQIPTIVQEKLK